jgi:hypothetical protein
MREMFRMASGLYKVTLIRIICILYFIAFSNVICSFWIRSCAEFFSGCNVTAVMYWTQCRCTSVYFRTVRLQPKLVKLLQLTWFEIFLFVFEGAFHITKASCNIFNVNSHTPTAGYELSHKLFSFSFN